MRGKLRHSARVRIPYYQIDAFTDRVFSGNPAGVCMLEQWLPDALLQQIALENSLSETAFVVPRAGEFELRWMTPAIEVDLCGHATLAPAHVLFEELGFAGETIRFHTKAGVLGASRGEAGRIVLDLPAWAPKPSAIPTELVDALGWIPRELHRTRDYLAVFANEEEIAALKPDLQKLSVLDCLGVICTAPGRGCDFVSRFFAPGAGVPEDPATGSAHCTLTPYWAARLGKKQLVARQLSARGGTFWCEDRGERVGVGGQCALYSRAELEVPGPRE
jgi:PhzF family phenazine biosynthesis protein